MVDMILEHPLIQNKNVEMAVYNEITPNYGTGFDSVAPGHDIESLKIASVYNLNKVGVVDRLGKLTDEAGLLYKGLDIKDDKTNKYVIKML
jgi:valyl-tRNA synthetase